MYRGQTVDFPCGRGGKNANANIYRIPITDLITARNIRFDGFAWRKAPGLALFGNEMAVAGGPSAMSGIDWRPDESTQRQVTAWDDGNVYKEVSGDLDAVTLETGLTFTNPVCFVPGGDIVSGDTKKLFLFSRGVAPIFLDADGVTMNPITAESIDWTVNKPSAAIYHDARIYAFDVVSAPHNLYISSILDHGDFASADSRVFEVQPGNGDRIVAAFSYLPQTLYIFKYPRGIFEIDTTDVTSFYLPSTMIRSDIGMSGPFGVCKVGPEVLFISSNGRIYSLNALRPDVDPREADITAKLNLTDFIKQNVDASKLNFARLIYDETRKELVYFYTSKDGTINDSSIVFDLNDDEVGLKAATDDRGEYFSAVWPRIGSDSFVEIITAGVNGFAYVMNSPARNIGGTLAYMGEFEYAPNDLGVKADALAGSQKRLDMIEITIVPTGDYFINCDIIIDGATVKTLQLSLGSAEAVFDDAEFDIDEFGGNVLLKHKVPIDTFGDHISVRFWNDGLNEDFNISNIRVFFRALGPNYES